MIVFVNSTGIDKNTEADHFLAEVSKELLKLSPKHVSFLINDKQLLSSSSNGQLTKNVNLHSTDVQKILHLAYDWPTSKSDGYRNINHSVVMILDQESRSRSPWVLIKWDLFQSVYLIIMAPLGFTEVFSCFYEILNLIPIDFHNKLSVNWRQALRLNNLLLRLQKSLRSYGNASDTVGELKIYLNSIMTPIYSTKSGDSAAAELLFDTKNAQSRKLINNLLAMLWHQLKGEAFFCKTEFIEKHLADITLNKYFDLNLKSCLAGLPPYTFDGPSPSNYQTNALCYRMKFHNRNICITYRESDMHKLVKLETATRRFKEVRMIKDAHSLSIIESSWTPEDSWTVAAVFEPFINLKLATKQTSHLGNLLRQLVNDNACSFQIALR